MIKTILLDMDGVLVDFLSGAMQVLNAALFYNFTEEHYIQSSTYNIENFYAISTEDLWEILNSATDFWIDLEPFPWAKKLYDDLSQIAPVVIASTPSTHPSCCQHKVRWLRKHLGVELEDVMLGSKKHLMANENTLLIDDLPANVEMFKTHGGQAICVPSNWNTPNLNYEKVVGTIKKHLPNN